MAKEKLTRMTKQGQITIPKDFRDQCHLEEGTIFQVERTVEGILFRPVETTARKITMPEIIERANKDLGEGKYTVLNSEEEIEDFIDGL